MNSLLVWLIAAQDEPGKHLSNLSCNLFSKLEPLIAGHQFSRIHSERGGDPLYPAYRKAPIILLQLLDLLP